MALTDEQMERMERNKALAMERKRQREQDAKPQTSSPRKHSLPIQSQDNHNMCPYSVSASNRLSMGSIPVEQSMSQQQPSSYRSNSFNQPIEVSDHQSLPLPPPQETSQVGHAQTSSSKYFSRQTVVAMDVVTQTVRIPVTSYDFDKNQQFVKSCEFNKSSMPSTPEETISSTVNMSSTNYKMSKSNAKRFHVPSSNSSLARVSDGGGGGESPEQSGNNHKDLESKENLDKKPSAFDVMMRTNNSKNKVGMSSHMTAKGTSGNSSIAPSYYNLTSDSPTPPSSSTTQSRYSSSSSQQAALSSSVDGASSKPAFPSWGQLKKLMSDKKNGAGKGVQLSEEQTAVLELALSGASIFFTGNAGTGKSTLLKEIISAMKEKHGASSLAITASTGAAATLISGTTIHSFSGCGLANERYYKEFKKKDYVLFSFFLFFFLHFSLVSMSTLKTHWCISFLIKCERFSCQSIKEQEQQKALDRHRLFGD
jgi:hypothetical protein